MQETSPFSRLPANTHLTFEAADLQSSECHVSTENGLCLSLPRRRECRLRHRIPASAGMTGWIVVSWIAFCFSTASAFTAEDPKTVQSQNAEAAGVQVDAEFFEKRVRPILIQRCNECHSSQKGAENGELVLETVAGIAAGGARGVLFHSDNSQKSLLLHVVEYTDPDLQMPPEGKLADDEIQILQQWVHQGAPLPEYKTEPRPAAHGIDLNAGKTFWSFQPLRAVDLPALSAQDQLWVRTPLDAFVRAKLAEKQLTPNPEADRAVLIRRLNYDVIGLPPTPAEVDDFVRSDAEDIYAATVTRLLQSPHYGERWARPWLDLARYSDFTPDWQSPTDRGWIYRDWVVDALNNNRPYNEFVRLQLAADLIPNTAPSDLAALGFLGLSPTYWKELRLAPSVIEQIVADEWDERIDAVTRTFLGLTVACARCHDHKFDPISTADYYALAGVFASTQLDERPLQAQPESDSIRAARRSLRELEAKRKLISDPKAAEAVALEKQIADLRSSVPQVDQPWAHLLRDASLYVQPDGDEMTRLEYRENEVRNLPVFRRGNPGNPGDIVPRRFLSVFQDDVTQPVRFTQGSGRQELADAIVDRSQGLLARVIVNRIWDQHFGAGLVRTNSDFGSQGDRPTHPELLEYLAYEFVAHGWDLKWLHREILMSATWRQSSAWREDAHSIDPGNTYLWRANRRRLDIEMWRDAMLAVSGQLDLTRGGPSKSVEDLSNVRRTLYVTIEREELNSMLRMHDFPEASSHSPRREPTTTPLQQLFVLNSPWMEKQAEMLWRQLESAGSDPERIRQCYRLLFSRQPDEQEISVAQSFLQSVSAGATDAASTERWKDYLQAMLGVNEFYFVD
jgi:hypothetical protein